MHKSFETSAHFKYDLRYKQRAKAIDDIPRIYGMGFLLNNSEKILQYTSEDEVRKDNFITYFVLFNRDLPQITTIKFNHFIIRHHEITVN